MTRQEALQEARRRWGPLAYVTGGGLDDWKIVGAQNAIEGEGATFEEAFANADRRESEASRD
jgi:hypothetical protein